MTWSEIQDAVQRELGWSPLRQVPADFELLVVRAETAALEYKRTSSLEALDRQSATWQAVQSHPAFEPAPLQFQLDSLNRSGIACLDRYARLGDARDFQAAESSWQLALSRAPAELPDRARFLHNLGSLVMVHYGNHGSPADLDRSIALFQESLAHPNVETRFLGLFHNSLGLAFKARYERQGTLADLESALFHAEKALEDTPEDHPQRGVYLNHLGNAYRMRFVRTQDEADVERAVSVLEESVGAVEHASSLPYRLTNLGNALLNRFDLLGLPEDLSRALEVHQQAVDLTPEGDKSRAIRLNNLGNSLSGMFVQTGNPEFLDRTIDSYQEALQHTAETDPLRASRLYNLGRSLRTRFAISGRQADREAASRVFREACNHGMVFSLEWALGAATSWGDWAAEREDWQEASEAYSFGRQAMDALYESQLIGQSQTTWLRHARDLTIRSAYVLARVGDFRQAVTVLERGRTRALNQALTRQEAQVAALPAPARSSLEAAYADIARFEAELQGGLAAGGRDYPVVAAELRAARQALTAVIEEIRAERPDFLPQGLDFIAIRELVEAVDRPLVYLLTAPGGSLALILAPGQPANSSPLHPVWIDAFDEDGLAGVLYEQSGEPGYLQGALFANREEFEPILDRIWPSLEQNLVGPLAAELQVMGYQGAFLVPTGNLSLLPLPALTLEDLTLSNLPSARALKTVLYDTDHVDATPRFVGVGDPASYGQPPLLFAGWEVQRISRLFSERGLPDRRLESAGATLAALVGQIPGATHLHFACHGRFEAAAPLTSALFLAGEERLTLQDLLSGELDVSAARLAVLSACQTGLVDFQNVPDEVVGFPAGFIQAGVPGVIGTLWQVDDLSTTYLLEKFYREHLAKDQEPGAALRAAQRWLRDATAEELDLSGSYRTIYEASGRRDRNAFHWMRYYQANPGAQPFTHPYFWAAFYFTGI